MYISRHQQILHYISNENILVGLTINNHTTSDVHVYDAIQINKTTPYIYPHVHNKYPWLYKI